MSLTEWKRQPGMSSVSARIQGGRVEKAELHGTWPSPMVLGLGSLVGYKKDVQAVDPDFWLWCLDPRSCIKVLQKGQGPED